MVRKCIVQDKKIKDGWRTFQRILKGIGKHLLGMTCTKVHSGEVNLITPFIYSFNIY